MKAKLVNRDLIKSRALTKAIVLLLLKERRDWSTSRRRTGNRDKDSEDKAPGNLSAVWSDARDGQGRSYQCHQLLSDSRPWPIPTKLVYLLVWIGQRFVRRMFLLLHRTLRIRGSLVFVSPTLNQARVEGLPLAWKGEMTVGADGHVL
jgi:hypothetical protein